MEATPLLRSLINLYRAHIHIMIRSWIIIKCNIKILIKLKWVWKIPDSQWFQEENLGFHSKPAVCHLFLSTSSLFSHEISTIRILIHSQWRNINHSEKNGFDEFTSVSINLKHLKLISKMDYSNSRSNNKARGVIDENPNPIRESEIKFQNPIIFRLRHFVLSGVSPFLSLLT